LNLPVLDINALQDLEQQLGSRDVADVFARNFAMLWPRRRRNLVSAIEQEDREKALDASISLRVSSIMVGGVRLASLAEALEALIRGGDFPGGRALLASIGHHGCATVHELQVRYITPPGQLGS
jgi:hypothetical protein